MTRKLSLQQSRRHVWVYDEDWEFIKTKYRGVMGPSEAIRKILHGVVSRIRTEEQEAIDKSVRAKP